MKALMATVVAAFLASGGLFLLAQQSPQRARLERQPAAGEIASMAERIQSLSGRVNAAETEARDASHLLADLTAQSAEAAQAEKSLEAELTQLKRDLPRLESAAKAAATAQQDALQSHADAVTKLAEFRNKVGPTSQQGKRDLELVDRERRRAQLTRKEQEELEYLPKDDKQLILKYLQHCDSYRRDVETWATSAKQRTRDCNALTDRLSTANRRFADAPHELNRAQSRLAQLPAAIEAAQADVTQKYAVLDGLKAQLASVTADRAAAVAAAEKKAADESRRLAESHRLDETRRFAAAKPPQQTAATAVAVPPLLVPVPGYEPMPRQRGALGSLRPGVRNLILATMAGVDAGMDLGDVGFSQPQISIPEACYEVHADGMGATYRQGNQTWVQRYDGPSATYTRDGPWEAIQYTNGVYGRRYYDDYRGVTQFDFVNPHRGTRTYGEEPYWGNDYGQGWSQQIPAWWPVE